jgi:hypothetical protein
MPLSDLEISRMYYASFNSLKGQNILFPIYIGLALMLLIEIVSIGLHACCVTKPLTYTLNLLEFSAHLFSSEFFDKVSAHCIFPCQILLRILLMGDRLTVCEQYLDGGYKAMQEVHQLYGVQTANKLDRLQKICHHRNLFIFLCCDSCKFPELYTLIVAYCSPL